MDINVSSAVLLCPPFVQSAITVQSSNQTFVVSVPKALFLTNVVQRTSSSVRSVHPDVYARSRVFRISQGPHRAQMVTFAFREQVQKMQFPAPKDTIVLRRLLTLRCTTTSVTLGFTAS